MKLESFGDGRIGVGAYLECIGTQAGDQRVAFPTDFPVLRS